MVIFNSYVSLPQGNSEGYRPILKTCPVAGFAPAVSNLLLHLIGRPQAFGIPGIYAENIEKGILKIRVDIDYWGATKINRKL